MIVNDHWRFGDELARKQHLLLQVESLRDRFSVQPTENTARECLVVLRQLGTLRSKGYTERLRLLLGELVGWQNVDPAVRACIEAWAEDERERLP